MKKYSLKLFVFLIASGSFIAINTGCDDVLEENPKHFSSPGTFYNSPEQIEAVIVGATRRLNGNWYGYGWAPEFVRLPNYSRSNNGIIGPDFGREMYSTHYHSIMNVNFALDAIINKNKLDGTPASVLDPLVGQLKFLRAFNYFQLVRYWGRVPIFTEEHVDNYFAYIPLQPSIPEVYDLIESDFQEAAAKLPEHWSAAQAGRPSRDAAKGFLAKVYLTRATAPVNDASYFPKAAALAKEVIDAGNYYLVEDIFGVFTFETEYGPEIMWGFNHNASHRSTDPRIWSGPHGWGDYSFSNQWVEDRYPEQPRKYAYIEMTDFYGTPTKDLGRPYGVRKYLYEGLEALQRGATIVNYPMLRFADVLLVFAEADNLANGGPTQAAVNAVNQVIDRANGYQENPAHPRVSIEMSTQEFDKAVIFERELELCREWDRYHDMQRKGNFMESVRANVAHNYGPNYILLPFPLSEIRLNPNMTQNPSMGD
jgi:starch-binding outer membrane protein, SusD/RagB family